MSIEKLLARVKSLQTDLSLEALSHPKDKSSFGYGFACGEISGLLRVEQLVQEMAEEDKRDQ